MSEPTNDGATTVKQRLQTALTSAMKARDEVAMSALRQVLSAISVAETAGDVQVALSDAQALAVIAVEVRQQHETADAFVTAGRPEQAERPLAEAALLESYLPVALGDDDVTAIIAGEVAAAAADGVTGMKAMGRVVAAVRAKAGPTADGAKIAAIVKAALA
jgi:uncharacterized protein YqeY